MMGLGLLGRGIGDALFLAPHVKELLITDKKNEEELRTSIETLKNELNSENFSKIKFVLGEHRDEDFINTDIVMKSAGVPLDSQYIKAARANNIPIYMSAALLVKIIYENTIVRKGGDEKVSDDNLNVMVIGVTGTRGKSTTTMMISHMLTTAGKRVHLGGNVRGVANLPLLDKIEDGDYLVLELDSWQLQGFGDLKISPQIAVFTSFLDDHMNYYKNDREAYFNDKANIFLYQNETDKLIINKDIEAKINQFCIEKNVKSNIITPPSFLQNMNLIGQHNQSIAGLASEVGIQLGLDYDDIVKGISSFKAVEGRLQYMVAYKNVIVYNDNNGTTPDAVIVGVEALNQKYKRPITLICGGSDKVLDLSNLVNVITDKSKVGNLILLAGTGTEKLKEAIAQTPSVALLYPVSPSGVVFKEFETLRECVEVAMRNTNSDLTPTLSKGEGATQNANETILLFSPGFASFSKYFKNEYERNDEFVKCVEEYK